MLFCLRGLKPQVQWPEGLPRRALEPEHRPGPDGFADPAADVACCSSMLENVVYRSPVMNRPIIDMLVWMRMPGGFRSLVALLWPCSWHANG